MKTLFIALCILLFLRLQIGVLRKRRARAANSPDFNAIHRRAEVA